MGKRPVCVVLLAFVLGEVIAVFEKSILWMGAVLLFLMLIKIITKTHISVFVVIFLFALSGYLATAEQVTWRNRMYDMPEQTMVIEGRVAKVQEERFGWNVFLKNHSLLVICETNPNLKIGNKVRVKGIVKQFDRARNDGNFDARDYYMAQGIYVKVKVEEMTVTDTHVDCMRQNLQTLKSGICARFRQWCNGKKQGIWQVLQGKGDIFAAVLMGEKSTLDGEIKTLYSMAGIAHILAISGLHITAIGMAVYQLLRRRFRFAISSGISIAVVVAFGIMSGMGIATVRAMVMFGLRLLGEVLGRTYDALTAMATAGLLLMLSHPFAVFHSGFQMSFAAIIAIVVVWPCVQQIWEIDAGQKSRRRETKKRGTDIRRKLLSSIAFSITIGLVMQPLIAYNYFQLPTYSFLLNMIVVPLMGIVVFSGLAGVGVYLVGSLFRLPEAVCTLMGRICLLPGSVILEGYTKICHWSMRLPCANVIVGRPSMATIVIYYGGLAVVVLLVRWRYHQKKQREEQRQKRIGTEGVDIVKEKVIRQKEKRRQCYFGVLCLCCVMLLDSMLYLPIFPLAYAYGRGAFFSGGGQLQVSFLDVGQGDGIFIQTDNGTTMTVDGGSTSVEDVGTYRIIPCLKSQGIRQIDYAVMTHADMDHISGLMEMLEDSDRQGIVVKHLVMPDIAKKDENYRQLLVLAKDHGVRVLYMTAGDVMQLGNTKITCIYPGKQTMAEDRNDVSTVLSVTYGSFSMLLTGDISTMPEPALQEKLEPHYTVLKVAHHGSNYSTSAAFLQWIQPDYAVISVGAHNLYGHPGKETLARLDACGSRILRTDESGAVTICTDGERITLETAIK